MTVISAGAGETPSDMMMSEMSCGALMRRMSSIGAVELLHPDVGGARIGDVAGEPDGFRRRSAPALGVGVGRRVVAPGVGSTAAGEPTVSVVNSVAPGSNVTWL